MTKWKLTALAIVSAIFVAGGSLAIHRAELSAQREQLRRENSSYWQGMLEGYRLGLTLDESDDFEREAVEQLISGEFIGGNGQ